MKNKCIFFTLVILSTYRIFQELLILLQLNLDKGGLQTLFTAIGILLISYILPLSFMSILFLYKKKISLIWFFYVTILWYFCHWTNFWLD
ncbi:membrane protein [Streptococcus uberis]|nr:membrane protein [Streptococcus uberis]